MWAGEGVFVDLKSHLTLGYFCASRILVTGNCDRYIKGDRPGGRLSMADGLCVSATLLHH